MSNAVSHLPGSSKGTNENAGSSIKNDKIFDEDTLNIINIPYDHNINPHSDGLGVLLLKALSSHGDDSISHINGDTDERVTYKQYYKKSVSLALNLLHKRIQSNDIVAVYAPNVIETDYIFCATQFIGNKISPIDPAVNDISYILKSLKPKLLFCWHEYISKVESVLLACQLKIEIIVMGGNTVNIYSYLRLDDFLTVTENENSFKAVVTESLFDTAVILFTNNTIRPKPVEINHYGLIVQNILIQNKLNCSRILITSSISWIISLIFLIVSAVTGSTKICLTNVSFKNYMEVLNKYEITCSFLSPYEIKWIFEDLKTSDNSNPSLININVTKQDKFIEDRTQEKQQEETKKELFTRIKTLLPNTKVKLIYSVTENSGFISMFDVDNDKEINGVLSCGYGLPGMSYKVIDVENDHILHSNKLGEIRIKSETIMNGYYNNTNATVKAFDFDGYFCTKDLGFYDDNYDFYITDRIKVKYEKGVVESSSTTSILSESQDDSENKKKVKFKDLIEAELYLSKQEPSVLNISIIIIPSMNQDIRAIVISK